MKTILITALVVLCTFNLHAQQTYTVNGESYELKTEVEGTLSLLWNIIDGRHRFFVKKDTSINELTNTKNDEGSYEKKYLVTLKAFTSDVDMDYSKVTLILYSLKDFVLQYNALVDNEEVNKSDRIAVKTRLGIFGGTTNQPFVTNPDNKLSIQTGVELEFYDLKFAKRHAAFLSLKHGFENKDLEYTATQLALGYRYRFIYAKKFNIYTNITLATLSNAKGNLIFLDDMDVLVTKKKSATNFDAPVIFGLGADIKVGENGFLTLSYGELFSLFFNNKGNFSTDFSIGYKFNL